MGLVKNFRLKMALMSIIAILLVIILIFLKKEPSDTIYTNNQTSQSVPTHNEELIPKTDLFYYQNAINSLERAKLNKSLEELDNSNKFFKELVTKYPKSKYIKKAKIELRQNELLRNTINRYYIIVDKINSYLENNEYQKALSYLFKSKQLIEHSDYEELKSNVVERRDKPIIVDIRDLLAESEKYDGKIVEVSDLHSISNDVKNKVFTTYKSTGSGGLDFDTDLKIDIRYKNAANVSQLVYLTDHHNSNLTVIGKYVAYSFFGSYIDAKEVKY